MINLILLIAPIFMIILAGSLLRTHLLKDDEVWNQINRLAYWVLFPCLLFNKTSVIDLEGLALIPLSVTTMTGFSAAILFAFFMGKIFGINAATLTSVMQGAGRHNAFLALAISTQLLGEQGAVIAALVIAVLVTFTNLVVNISMTVILANSGGGFGNVLRDLRRNPFIIAIILGAMFNAMGFGGLPIVHSFTQSVGETTLPIALLCVGAGLRLKGVGEKTVPIVIASTGKFIVFPLVVFGLAQSFNLDPNLAIVAMIFAVSPTGAASYPLAKQLGGDAPLMATLISLQTLVSILLIPMALFLFYGGEVG